MRFVITAFILISSVFAGVAGATTVEIKGNGVRKTIEVPAGFSGSKITAYLVSKGNVTEYFSLGVTGPAGAVITAKSAKLSGRAPAAITKTRAWAPAIFIDFSGKEKTSLKLKGFQAAANSISRFARASGAYCGGLTAEVIDQTIADLLRFTGQTFTRDEICEAFGESGAGEIPIGNPGGGGSGSGSGGGAVYTPTSSSAESSGVLVRKDTCSTKPSDKYLVVFEISLKDVSAADKQNGFKLEVSATEVVHNGSKAATLKPHSDGKFAPRALFLLSSTGGYGGEHLNIVKWSKGKIASIKKAKVEDYVYYRGLNLTRSIAEPFLRGGNATVEVQSRSGIYSVCFAMAKRRQRVNGYTN